MGLLFLAPTAGGRDVSKLYRLQGSQQVETLYLLPNAHILQLKAWP